MTVVSFSTLPIEGSDGYKKIPLLRENGVKNIEITWSTGITLDDREKLIDQTAEVLKTGINISSSHAPLFKEGRDLDISSTDNWDRKFAIREIQKSIIAFSMLTHQRESGIVIHCGRKFDFSERKAKIAKSVESLKEILDFNGDYGFELRLENTLPGELGCFLEDLCEIREKLNSPKVRFCFDTGHYNIGEKRDDILKDIAPDIAEFHIHDNFGKTDDHLPPGDGNIDFGKFPISKDSYFVFELKKFSPDDIKECLKWLKG